MTSVELGPLLTTDLLMEFNAATPLSDSSAGVVLGGKHGLDFLLHGTNLGDFDAAGYPHSGTITEFSVAQGDRTGLNWTQMDVDAGKFIAAMHSGNVDAVGNLVFAGNDFFDVAGSIDGAPANVFKGYGGNDTFHVNLSLHGAAIETDGGNGRDIFNYDNNFDAATDRIDGGNSVDTLNLTGGSASDLTFGAASMVNVEKIVLGAQSSYAMTMNDANVAAGATLSVSANALVVRNLVFDGHAETDGSYVVTGSHLNDTIITGAGKDTITGGLGGDTMTGGAGADTFNFAGHYGADTITDFAATGTGHDVLHFAANDFASFAALHMAQVGTDVVITASAHDTLTLQHVTLSDLTAQDFLFG